jgi:ribose 5-phosphate isomerase B
VCIGANKVPGVRAGVVRDDQDAQMIRLHNDANIACFGERVTDEVTAVSALAVFMTTDFEGGRHQARVDQLAALDRGEDV